MVFPEKMPPSNHFNFQSGKSSQNGYHAVNGHLSKENHRDLDGSFDPLTATSSHSQLEDGSQEGSIGWENTEDTGASVSSVELPLDLTNGVIRDADLSNNGNICDNNLVLRDVDLNLEDEPLSEPEQYLADAFPDLADSLKRLKLVAGVSSLGESFLDPLTGQLESEIDGFREIQVYGRNLTEENMEMITYLSETARRLENELLPILEAFGLGLPTEDWHVNATQAAVAEKLRTRAADFLSQK